MREIVHIQVGQCGNQIGAKTMPISSFIRSPVSDLTGTLVTHQDFGPCADFEMKAVSCLEAYGHIRGIRTCKDLLQDYKECFLMIKQTKRFEEMRKERRRQYRCGERSKDELFAEGPTVDSFQ